MESKSDYKKLMNYVHYTLGYSISETNKMIKRYGIMVAHIKFPKNSLTPGYYEHRQMALEETGIYAQAHWQSFMEFYGSVKHEYSREPRKPQAIIQSSILVDNSMELL